MPYDEEYVQALEQGMPPAAGSAWDRPPRDVAHRTDSIREVVLFPALRTLTARLRGAGW